MAQENRIKVNAKLLKVVSLYLSVNEFQKKFDASLARSGLAPYYLYLVLLFRPFKKAKVMIGSGTRSGMTTSLPEKPHRRE